MAEPPGIEVDLTQVKLRAREPWPLHSLLVWPVAAALYAGTLYGSAALTAVVGAVVGSVLAAGAIGFFTTAAFILLSVSRRRQTLTLTPDELREEIHRWGRMVYQRDTPLDEITRVSLEETSLVIATGTEDVVVDQLNVGREALAWMAPRIESAVRAKRRSGRPVVEERLPPPALRKLLREPER